MVPHGVAAPHPSVKATFTILYHFLGFCFVQVKRQLTQISIVLIVDSVERRIANTGTVRMQHQRPTLIIVMPLICLPPYLASHNIHHPFANVVYADGR